MTDNTFETKVLHESVTYIYFVFFCKTKTKYTIPPCCSK